MKIICQKLNFFSLHLFYVFFVFGVVFFFPSISLANFYNYDLQNDLVDLNIDWSSAPSAIFIESTTEQSYLYDSSHFPLEMGKQYWVTLSWENNNGIISAYDDPAYSAVYNLSASSATDFGYTFIEYQDSFFHLNCDINYNISCNSSAKINKICISDVSFSECQNLENDPIEGVFLDQAVNNFTTSAGGINFLGTLFAIPIIIAIYITLIRPFDV